MNGASRTRSRTRSTGWGRRSRRRTWSGCSLLFTVWEGRNGARPEETNDLACRLAAAVEEYLASCERHGRPPAHLDRPHRRLRRPRRARHRDDVDRGARRRRRRSSSQRVMRATATPDGAHGSTVKLAHALGALARERLPRRRRRRCRRSPRRRCARSSTRTPTTQRCATRRSRATSRQLTRLFGSKARDGGVGLTHLDSLGPRLSALVAAAARAGAVPRHRPPPRRRAAPGSARSRRRSSANERRHVSSTHWSSPTPSTRRTAWQERCAGWQPRERAAPAAPCGGRARGRLRARPGLIAFSPDWTLPLPTYEELELRFPLITDVLADVERAAAARHPRRDARAGRRLRARRRAAARHPGRRLVPHRARPVRAAPHPATCSSRRRWTSGSNGSTGSAASCSRRRTAVADALRARGHANVGVWGRGVDTERLRAAPPQRRCCATTSSSDGNVLLLSVGRLSDEKRLERPARSVRPAARARARSAARDRRRRPRAPASSKPPRRPASRSSASCAATRSPRSTRAPTSSASRRRPTPSAR